MTLHVSTKAWSEGIGHVDKSWGLWQRKYGNEKAAFTLPHEHQGQPASSIFSAKSRQIAKIEVNTQSTNSQTQTPTAQTAKTNRSASVLKQSGPITSSASDNHHQPGGDSQGPNQP
jgi:hypothetical protein